MKKVKLFDTTYPDEISFEGRFIYEYDIMPSSYINTNVKYNLKLIEYLKSLKFIIDVTIERIDKREKMVTEILLINYNKKLFVKLLLEVNEIINFKLIYDGKTPLTNQFNIKYLENFQIKIKTGNISLISFQNGYFNLEEYSLKSPDVNLTLNYGKDFLEIHKTIFKKLNTKNEKGIVLLHGDPGTGKTTYLRYLANTLDKRILFIPPSMAESLSEPSIIPFLMENTNTILIIEDAEKVISDRDIHGSSPGVSNILNLTDGILGDCLNIQIIATFNMEKEKIDNALLRKGRLIAEHEFKSLSTKDTNVLLRKLNKNIISDKGLVLSDIYNIDIEEYKTIKKQKIGF